MTVKELKAILEAYDDNTEVHIGYTSGDYWGTKLAPSIERVNLRKIVYSNYDDCHKIPKRIDEDDEVKEVLVIS
jgi:hypothetical protein